MALYRDEAVVIRAVKLGEADRIITLITKKHGKVRAVAKGVRRIKTKFGGRLDLFMRNDMLIAQGRNLDTISQVSTISAYSHNIGTHYESFLAANVIAQCADLLINTEHQQATDQYLLLIGALNALATGAHDSEHIAYSYILRSLKIAGWTPRLQSCVTCNTNENLTSFSVQAGGLMCQEHTIAGAFRVSKSTIEQLRALLEGNWAVLQGVQLDSQVHAIVNNWSQYYLEHPIRSLDLLHS
ncbi:MAG: DNA repair protein RecO [Bifidobacteriaceae bacterium]|nr:DNA repair protein RecO [Bifidobacteriaceae bacterium]